MISIEKFSLVQKKLMLGIQSSSFENINNISLIFKMMEDLQSNWFKNLMIFDYYWQVYIFVSIVSSWFKKTDWYLKFYMMVNIQYIWFKNLMKFNWYWRYIKQFIWFKKSAGKWWSSYNRCVLKKITFDLWLRQGPSVSRNLRYLLTIQKFVWCLTYNPISDWYLIIHILSHWFKE